MKKSKNRCKLKILAGSTILVSLLGTGVFSTYAAFSDEGSASITAGSATINYTETYPRSSFGVPYINNDGYLKPNTDYNSTVVVRNTGTAPLNYKIRLTDGARNSESALKLASYCNITLKDGTTILYSGRMSTLSSTQLTISPNVTKNIEVTVRCNSSREFRDYIGRSKVENLHLSTEYYM